MARLLACALAALLTACAPSRPAYPPSPSICQADPERCRTYRARPADRPWPRDAGPDAFERALVPQNAP